MLALTNVMGSQATRDADAVLYTRSGLEVSVAATKTFIEPGRGHVPARALARSGPWHLPAERIRELIAEMKMLPHAVQQTIPMVDETVRRMAEHHRDGRFFLYLGRTIGLPVCLEGALKMKEITYVPSDAYAAGEMKHGPIALLDESTPVVCVATDSPILEKTLSNVAEVRARGASVIAIATEGRDEVAQVTEETIFVPRTDWLLQPIVAIIPLQLLAYHVARLRGLNVDQPRNLAKTVTVE